MTTENPDSLRPYISDLIEISGMSRSAVAGKAGVFRGNLQRWLKGEGQSLGPPGIAKILAVLGVEGGRLSGSVVHFFDVKDPDLLVRVLGREETDFQMVFVAPEKSAPKDFLTLGITVPLFLFGPNLRIVVWQPSAFSSSVIPSLLSAGVEWLPVPPDPFFSHPTLRVSREAFDLARSKELSLSDFDMIVSPEGKDPSWGDVAERAEHLGLSPRDVLRLLEEKRKGRKK